VADAPRHSADALLSFARDAFVACGLPEGDAATVAERLIEADLTGFDTHGIFRLASYCTTLRSGRVNPKPAVKVLNRAPATALLDGDNGMGHLVMTRATELAIELARESGIGWVGVRRSNHAGAAGVYAEMPVKHGMVGIYAAVSTANHMAPWGGAEALIGTNPIAIAIPAGNDAPVVLDIATSVSSFGTIRVHQVTGEPMPEGWAVHSETGQPISDPKRVGEGVLLPIGGYKGSGLALTIGLLAGTLNGAAFGRDVIDFNQPGTQETNTGQFVAAIDVKRFVPMETFGAEVDRHLAELRASKRLPGVERIRTPGEDRVRRRAARVRDGLALPLPLGKQLDELAATLGIAPLAGR
jgi:L-2-hydroxycarboxylate dehydrogenase (NAD+)